MRLATQGLIRWGYFLYFLLNRSECVPVLSMTRISSWSCCSMRLRNICSCSFIVF